MNSAAPQPIERLLTVSDVANALSSTDETVRRFIHTGELAASRIGRRYLITPTSLNEFINRKRSR